MCVRARRLQIVCELLDAARPSGLFRVLDDTCKTMHGTRDAMDVDKKFLETAGQVHGSHAHFSSNNRYGVYNMEWYRGYVSERYGEICLYSST